MGAIDHKVAIVTGGAGGIGGAIVQRFAREGAKVAVVDLDGAAATAVTADLSARGTDAAAIHADVTSKKAVSEMTATVLAHWDRIDILVNVAGGAERKPVIEMTAEDWDRVVDMNLKSTFLCS